MNERNTSGARSPHGNRPLKRSIRAWGCRARTCIVCAVVAALLLVTGASLVSPRQARAADGEISLTIGTLINYGGTGTSMMYADEKPAFCAEPSLPAPAAGAYLRSDLDTESGQNDLLRAVLYFGAGGPGQAEVDWPLFVGYSGQTDFQKVWADTHILTACAWSGSISDALHRVEGSWQERREWFLYNLFGMSEDGHVTNDNATLQQIKRKVDEVPDDFYVYQIETGSSSQIIVSWTYAVDVIIEKKSGDESLTQGGKAYSLSGAVFEIRRARDGELVATVTTDEHGRASCSVAPNEHYYAQETTPPSGYKLNGERHDFTVGSSTVTVAVENEPATLSINLLKADSVTGGAAQAGALLAGADYQLTDATGNTHTATSDEDGRLSFTNLPLGTVTLIETKAPVGYLPDTAVHTYRVDTESVHENIELAPEDSLLEVPISFDVEIVKYLDEGNDGSGLQTPGAGIAFQIISNTTGEVVGTVTTDEAGRATTEGRWFGAGSTTEGLGGALPYDQEGYTVREDPETVPNGYQAAPDWTIEADQMVDGVTLHYIVDNDFVASRIHIVKVDADTGIAIPLPGFTFQLLDADKQPITQEAWHPNHSELTEFTTDETGSVTLPEPLKPGTYYVREIAAAPPYLLSQEDVEFTIADEADVPPITTVTVPNERPTGTVTITKKCSADGTALAGAEFDIVAKEDIVAPDGSVDAPMGTTVAHIVTDEQGKGSAVGLPIGSSAASYEAVETEAPEGHALDTTPHPFTLTYEDAQKDVVLASIKVDNAPTSIVAKKSDAGSGSPLAGAVFELRDAEDEPGGESAVQATTDENGIASWSHLSPGAYHIQEISAPDGYLVDKTTHTVEVDGAGLIEGNPVLELTFENDFTKVDISKRDITDENPVEGAVLSVLDSEGTVIETWISTEEDHRIERLAPGTYTLVEEVTPNSYEMAQKVSFTVKATGEIQRVVMYDEPIAVTGEIDKRQEIADPTAAGTEANGDGANTAEVTVSKEGLYDYSLDFRNTSSTWVDECTVTDELEMAIDGTACLVSVSTPQVTGDYDGLFNVWYRTNSVPDAYLDPSLANATLTDGHENPWLDHESTQEALSEDARVIDYGGWQLWAEDVRADESQTFAVSDLALREDEVVTAIRFEFGRVEEDFTSRNDLWDRENLKDAHDDVDSIDPVRTGETVLSGAILRMQVTDDYRDDVKLSNIAKIDLFRNGGDISEGTQLEAHDEDKVEQMPKSTAGTLAKTGVASVMPAIVTTASVAALGIIITTGASIRRKAKKHHG